MEAVRRLRVRGSSASETSPKRQRARRLAAAAALASAVAAVALAASIPPGDVRIDLPVYSIREPADRFDERWSYRFAWSGLPVGSLVISVTTEAGSPPTASRPRLSVELRGRTTPLVDLLWKYRLEADATIRLDPLAPGTYAAREIERGTTKTTRIEFDERRRVRTARRKGARVQEFELEAPNTFDMVSTVFLALNLDYEPGAVYRFDTLTGTARYLVTARAAARETIAVAGARRDAWRLEITTRELTDPDEEEKHRATDLWVSAERPRRLLRARSRTFVGAIQVDLVSIESVTLQSSSNLDLLTGNT